MKRRINLDTSSIKRLINDLQLYQKSMDEKCALLVNRLADIGIEVINIEYGSGMGDSSKEYNIDPKYEDGFTKMKIVVNGKDILFIEFGSGIHFNNGNFHPKAKELGYGIGSYPGQTHAFDPNGWYYRDKHNKKKLHHSLGTEATMPLYKASQKMSEEVERIAKEVFGSG